jgi:hypothetical protein
MRFFTRVLFLTGLVASAATPSFAQEDIDQLISKSLSDGKILIGAYISPVMKSVSAGLNQGWYNTAKAHKIAGIDITVTANAMTIPSSDLLFKPDNLNLQQVELVSSGNPDRQAPTLAGPDITTTYRLKGETSADATFDGPPGLDLKGNIGNNWIPVPMAHVGIGLPKGTDLKIRYSPTIDLGDEGSVKIFGLGVMHDIKQWIPGIKLLPFDLSGFVGYTKFKLDTKFDGQEIDGADQKGVFEMSATTIQGLISKKFSVVTFYGGVGYNIAKSNLAMKGWYDIDDDDNRDTDEVNPIDLKFASSGPRATVGMRLKLAVLTLHADYTLQKYKCLTAGIGLSVR